jgi:dTDP-4-amino-4,6-dideoxygalactose transaminase
LATCSTTADIGDKHQMAFGENGMEIKFNKPFATGEELEYIAQAIESGVIGGDGAFTAKCNHWLKAKTGCSKALLTHSCTAALEMAAILCDIQPGDEVIVPSFSFVTTANSFVLRGGVPVFVDIRTDTLNIDESLIEEAISPRTRAIVPVHYAGVGCEMDAIMAIAGKHDLFVIEDAAQGIMASYKGRALGSMGDIGCYSFHETKNIVSGEGGALLINNPKYEARAEIIREKGTNRSQFFRGEADKYTWVDYGSSYLPSDLVAAFLWSQFRQAEKITQRRLAIWEKYHEAFASAEASGAIRRPSIPDNCIHNGHMYYLILQSPRLRTEFIEKLKNVGIQSTFHYVPLHSSPFGSKVGRTSGSLANTEDLSERLVRLPLWLGLEEEQDDVVSHVLDAISYSRSEN